MIPHLLKSACCALTLGCIAAASAEPEANRVIGNPARVEFRGAARCAQWTAPQQYERPEWRGRVVLQVRAQLQGGRMKEAEMRLLAAPTDLPKQADRALENSVISTMDGWRCDPDAALDVVFTFER